MIELNLQFFGGRGGSGGKRSSESTGQTRDIRDYLSKESAATAVEGKDKDTLQLKGKDRDNEALKTMLKNSGWKQTSAIKDTWEYNKSSADNSLKSTVDKAVNRLKEPEKFKSTAINVKGITNDTIEIRIAQGSSKEGFSATINTQGGGRFQSNNHATFAEAKNAVDSLLEKYIRNKTRFKRDKNAAQELMREISK